MQNFEKQDTSSPESPLKSVQNLGKVALTHLDLLLQRLLFVLHVNYTPTNPAEISPPASPLPL